jgi:multidrug efflux pump
VLTLYTTPVIYLFFDRLAAKFSRSRAAEQSKGGLPEAAPA